MIKRTYNNFLTAMEILQNQAGMTKAEAERRTRQIFDSVEYQRKVLKIPVTVEDLLVAEINSANAKTRKERKKNNEKF
jgi:hypothetical protein